MNREKLSAICATLPGATLTDPWGGGHDAWKVGGKMFASVGTMDTGISVKTSDVETAGLLIEMGRAERAAYFHKSWVHLPWGIVDDAEMAERVVNSYRIIRSGLTKKMQASLEELGGSQGN